jgi:hypothetical protein
MRRQGSDETIDGVHAFKEDSQLGISQTIPHQAVEMSYPFFG